MTLTDIRNKVYFLTSTNSSSFPDTTLVVEANNALDRVVSLIMQSDGRWQFDDENNTDLPIATTAVVSGQQDYALSTSHLQITRMEILDSTGTWHKLLPLDQADVYNQSLTTFLSSTSGLPTYYDKLGNSVFLYPSPNYSVSAGLKVWFKRAPSYFLTSDSTKTPGFNTLYHELIPLWIAYNFALANGKDNASGIYQQILSKEDALHDDYSRRDKDENLSLRPRPRSYR